MTEKSVEKRLERRLDSKFRLEAQRSRGGMSLVFSGIIGVEGFTKEHVRMKSHGAVVELRGKKLEITVFENNDVEVWGKVEGIDFIYGKT